MGRTAAASTISTVPGSSNGRTCSTRTGIVTGAVGLPDGGAGDAGSLICADKDVEDIAHEEVLPTRHGGDPMQPTDMSLPPGPSTTTTAKKRGKKRPEAPALEVEASVSTPKKRAPRGPKPPAKRRKVDKPTPVKVEEEDTALAKEADLPKTPKRRKLNPSTAVKVEEEGDPLAKTITSGDLPKTPRKRGRPPRVNKETADTTTPVSPTKTKPKSPVKRRTTVKDGVKEPMETAVDDQTNLVAETEPVSSVTVTPRKGRVKGTASSSSPAKRKRRASVDGSPSKKRRYGLVKSEHAEPLSIMPASLPLLQFPSSNTPSLWASDKAELMILTSKLNTVATIFVDQESAIGIAIQDDGEVELSITRDSGSQSLSIDLLNLLDEPEAPKPLQSPPKETSAPSIDLVDSRPSTPAREPQIPTAHPSNPISSPSDDSSGGVNPTPQSSSTQAVEMASSDYSPPGLSHEPLKTRSSQTSCVVLQHTSFEDHTPRNTVILSAPSSPPVARVSPSPPNLDKPHLTTTSLPRDKTFSDAKQTHIPSDSNHAPLPSPRPPPPRPRHWDQNWDDSPQEPPSQRPGTPPRHDRHWDSEWDNHPRETSNQRSGSPVRHHKRWNNKCDKYPRETGGQRPSYTSYEEHSPLPIVAQDLRREPLSNRPSGRDKTKDPRRHSPPRRSPPTSSYPDYQDHVKEGKPRVSTSRPSKSKLPSFKKIRSASSSGALPPVSASTTNWSSTPLPPGLSTSEPQSMQAVPSLLDYTRPDAQLHGRSHLQVPAGDYSHLPSPSPSTSSRHVFYSQPDHPHRRTEASSGVYSERLESYSSKRSSLSVYMNNRFGIGSRWDRNASKGQARTPISCCPPVPRPLPQISTAPPAPVIKEEEADEVYPPGLSLNAWSAGGPPRLVPKRSSSPPLHVLSATPPPVDLLNKSRPSSPDSLYAVSPRVRDAKPLDIPLSSSCEDMYMLDEVNTLEAGQNSSLQRQLQVEQTLNTDPARQGPKVLQEIDDASEPNPNIHDPLETASPDIPRSTTDDAVFPKQSDSSSLRADELNVVPPIANETEQIVSDLPEVRQFTDTDSPVLLFVLLPGYGYASLGYFRNLGIVSKASIEDGEGRRMVWRIRLRWVADEEYGEIEDENMTKGCWWSEQRILGLEDKVVRDQCPGLGTGMRTVERWWCRECGRVNRENGWRWRKCLSEKCKDKQPEFLKALSLDEVRGRNDRMPMARPHGIASIPGIMTTTWEDGTVTYMYPLSSTCLVKHIFTGNYPPLQDDASKLWVGLQSQGVELIRGRDGPYYTCAFAGNSNDWPGSVKEASEVVSDSAVGYGEFPSGMVIQRVEVLAWFIKGSAKIKAHETEAVSQVLHAKHNLVGILSLGCEVEVVLHKCRTVAELAFKAEDGTEPVTVDAVPSTAKPTSPRKRKVADVSDLSIHMVHGDVLVLSGDDFYYSIKRSGGGMLVIASSGV